MRVDALITAARDYKEAVLGLYEHVQTAHDSHLKRDHACVQCDVLGHRVEAAKEQLTGVALRFE